VDHEAGGFEIAAGEPARQITIDTVRRLARRRTVAAVAAAVAIALIVGAGAAVAARAVGSQPVSATGLPSGVPRYYYESGYTNSGGLVNVIRATTGGSITATVHCPVPSSRMTITSVAPVGLHTFFMMCTRPRQNAVAAESRIYGFRLTRSGRINGYFRVRGGELGALGAYNLTATADGSRVAVLLAPGSNGRSSPAEILVIDARTGAHALWFGPKKVPGAVYFSFYEASFTGNGHELAVLGPARCVKGPNAPTCKSATGEEIRAYDVAGPGGRLGQGRILLLQSSIMSPALDYINDAVISLDGSTLILTEVGSARGIASGFVEVLAVSAQNSKNRHVIFKMSTGDGFSYRNFSADPFRRHFILDAGPANDTKNGWIYRGRLVPLKPQGDNVGSEVW
jgi:hypothetical protein